jgi:hypothetical protein
VLSEALLVRVTRYEAAARVNGTSTTTSVSVNEKTVLEIPPTVTVGAAPVGLKFAPATAI